MYNKTYELRRKRRFFEAERTNPLHGLANLVDVMLVFACGLMISIILLWDLDLLKITDVVSKDELVEVEDLKEAEEQAELKENLDSKGIVYEDEKTGKMYIIKK